MKNSKKEKLIPELRFPGFEDTWKESSIKEFEIKIVDGDRGVNYPKKGEFREKGYCVFLNAGNVTSEGFSFDEKVFITREKDKALNKGRLKRGDVVLTSRGTVGNISFYGEKIPYDNMRINSGMLLVRNSSNNIKDNFLYYIFISPQVQKYIKRISFGSAQPQLTVKDVNKIKLRLPRDIKEQQKIASFLSLIDKKIELLKKKKELLELYKKGVMQKIFNREIRFKDENGNDYPEWEEKRLGEICNITTGKLDANAMVENGKYRFYTCAAEYYYTDSYAFDTDALIISGNGANVGYIHNYKGKFNAYQRTYVLDKFSEDIKYVKAFLNRYLGMRIDKEKKTSNTPYIVLGTLRDMKIKLPQKEEQEEIRKFFRDLEKKIEYSQRVIENFKVFKMALLQKMFI